MGKSKKQSTEPVAPDGVDMEHIKELMGPLPNEAVIMTDSEAVKPEAPNEPVAPLTAPEVIKEDKAINEAVEEANETLKAMSANLDKNPPLDPMPKTAEESEITDDGVAADDPGTVLAVDDIVANEADEVLEAEDDARDKTEEPKQKAGLGTWIKNLWSKPAAKWTIVGVVAALMITTLALPVSRYFILNTAGVRGSLSVSVIDTSTQLPLKNVTVTAGNISAATNSEGNAVLKKVKLGATTLHISKRAFQDIDQKVTIGWGSNPLGKFSLNATGSQYTFFVTDYLTGKPVEKAEASSGEGNALSDKNGKILLALETKDKADTDELSVVIALGGYRSETVKIKAGSKSANKVKLVSSSKDVFVSNRSGKYDIYSIDIDGKNEKKIVNGTGLERADLKLAIQPNSKIAAYVATRENVKNSDGYLLSTLYLLDEDSGTLNKIDQSEQIQLVGWSNDGRLVYIKIAAGTSAGNSKRTRLVSVNTKSSNESKELASANYFNDVIMAGNRVLYAPSGSSQATKFGLYSINADGSGSLAISDKQIYNIFRSDYDSVTIYATDGEYTYTIGGASSTLSATKTPKQTNLLFADNQSGSKSLWTETRDGKNMLLIHDKTTKKDTTLTTFPGMTIPVVWLSDTVVAYRVSDGKQTADYVVSTDGGTPQKVTDLTNVAGITRWYYY